MAFLADSSASSFPRRPTCAATQEKHRNLLCSISLSIEMMIALMMFDFMFDHGAESDFRTLWLSDKIIALLEEDFENQMTACWIAMASHEKIE